MCIRRAKAKKRKTDGSTSTPEKPGTENLEVVKGQTEKTVEPPLQKEPPPTEEVDTQAGARDEVGDINPPSPARASSPTPAAEGMVVSSPQAIEDVIITGASSKSPEPSTTLAKLETKDEPVASEKGKAKLELPNLEELSASDLHEA